MKVQFQLSGTMPTIMHRDSVEWADELDEWRKHPDNKNFSKPGDDRSPPWTWIGYLYHDGENVAYPFENIMALFRRASADVILKKQKSFKALSQSGIIPLSEYAEFRSNGKQFPMATFLEWKEENLEFKKQADAVRDMGFQLFVKRVRIGQSKHIRVRPRFDNWTVSGAFEIVAPEITFDVLDRFFQIACRLGLSEWGPWSRTPGPFGTFTHKLKKVA